MKELLIVESLKNSFHKLPGVGLKSAERMAYAFLAMKDEDKKDFLESLGNAIENVHVCPNCGLYTEQDDEVCDVCSDSNRDRTTICVVAEIKDALTIENSGLYNGLYHVLGGVISASKGMSPDSLTIDKLIKRVDEGEIKEVILATSPTVDGEMTGLFIAKLLEPKNVTITHLAYGLPMGSSLTYADNLTLSKAFEGRRKI